MHRALLLLIALPLSAQILVNTFAGGAIPSGVPAQNVYLASVNGLAWDGSGNLVFCDSVNNVIRRVDANGNIETIAGNGMTGFAGDGGPALAAELSSPGAPYFAASGNLYFADRMNYRIRKIDTRGIITTVAGDGIPFSAGMNAAGPAASISLDYISDLAVDSAGNIYFVEQNRNRIRRVTPAGQVDVFVTDGLSQPTAIALGSDDTLFVLDQSNTVIRKVAPDGTISTFVGPIYDPSGGPEQFPIRISAIAADPAGSLYADYPIEGVDFLMRYDANAKPATAGNNLNAKFLAINSVGDIAFSRALTNSGAEIGEIAPPSTVKMLAGFTPQPAPDGAPLNQAWFFDPTSIAFDPAGDLYIADRGACEIREIDTAGVLSTFAGTGRCAQQLPSGNAKTAALTPPVSIAVDSHNNVEMSDIYSNLYSIAPDGTILFPKIVTAPQIRWMAFDSKDRLYVGGTDALVRVNVDHSVQQVVPLLSRVEVDGMGTDPSGNVYFGSDSKLERINDDATYAPVASNPNTFTSYGNNPAFALDAAGNIWQGSAVIRSLGTALFGTAALSGDGGPAASAGFNVSAVAFTPGGQLYMIDTNRIRVLSGQGPSQAPSIAQGGIVNAASFTGGRVAPGELISIFGSNFGAEALETNAAVNNSIPTSLGRTRVLFNGRPGAITAVTPNQINVFVPPLFNGSATSVQIQVQVDATLSQRVTVPLADAAPAFFTSSGSGSGQGAILNQDGSVNSSANPAAPGSIVSFFGTGEGVTAPLLEPGNLVLSLPYPAPTDKVSVSIGGVAAETTYIGEAPNLPTGVFQINARIPAGTPSGDVPVAVSYGLNSSPATVTIAVR